MTKAASFRPESFKEGGGLLDNADVRWDKLRFVMYDYNGNTDDGLPKPTLLIVMTDKADGKEYEQYFSVGAKGEPSEDGKQLLGTDINKTSKVGILLLSLFDAGFPPEKLDDDITVLEGLECHMVQVDAPERKGLIQRERADGKQFKKTNLVVDAIHKLPWEKKGGTTSATATKGKTEEGAGAGSGGGDEGTTSSVDDLATNAIMEVIDKVPKGGWDKKEIVTKIWPLIKALPNKAAISQRVMEDEFLNSGPWTFKNGKVTM